MGRRAGAVGLPDGENIDVSRPPPDQPQGLQRGTSDHHELVPSAHSAKLLFQRPEDDLYPLWRDLHDRSIDDGVGCSTSRIRMKTILELAGLRSQIAKESKKAADASAKAAKARAAAAQARSETTPKTKAREADREEGKVIQAQKKRADLEAKVAQKTTELSKLESKLADRDAKALREIEAEAKRRSQIRHGRLLDELGFVARSGRSPGPARSYDFFISHATPDKERVARPLAELLMERGCEVWIDEQEIRVSNSIRQKIDDGLARSRFGIVVLSKHFLEGRTWTERELNGLFVREEGAGEVRILPIWHEVSKEEVARYSPILADKHALKTADYTLEEIADLLVERLGPRDAGGS